MTDTETPALTLEQIQAMPRDALPTEVRMWADIENALSLYRCVKHNDDTNALALVVSKALIRLGYRLLDSETIAKQEAIYRKRIINEIASLQAELARLDAGEGN